MNLYILIGPPGSGKSTFSKHLNAYRISQDDLGSKDACIRVFRKLAEENKPIVIDRCNHNFRQRSSWIKLGKEFGYKIIGVKLEVPLDILHKRVIERKNHPTIKNMTEREIKSIISRFRKDEQYPLLSEGFDSIVILKGE